MVLRIIDAKIDGEQFISYSNLHHGLLYLLNGKVIVNNVEALELDKNQLMEFQQDGEGFSIKAEETKNTKEGGINQKLKLFKRGKAISGAPINKGNNQLPKPPIKAGMTIKKIIKKACAVTNTL